MPKDCCDPKDIPRRLCDIEVLKVPDEKRVKVGTLWKERPVLLCMFRRWGCGICRMSAANLSAAAPLLEAKGVQLAGFGIERIGFEDFYKGGYFTGDLYIDVDTKAYKALELRENSWRNLWGLLDGGVLKLFNLSKEKGYENNLQGNINQLGGTFLIMPDGSVPYAHFQSKDSFEPDLFKIMEVLDVVPPQDYELYPAYSSSKLQCKDRKTCGT